jgi:CheY-like chemotaxis protein
MHLFPTMQISSRASLRLPSTKHTVRPTGFKELLMSKILIVVDEAARLQEVAEILESEGYSTKTIQTSAEMFRILSRTEPDILLVAQSMPGIGNIMILAFIRHATEMGAMKVLVLMQDAEAAKTAKVLWNADVSLTSSLSREALLEAVSAHFQ